MAFDGRLWHGTGANTTADRRRYGILTYYCRPYIRQQQNFFLNLDPAVLADATPTLRRLLGYGSDAGLGAVNALSDEYRQPGLRPGVPARRSIFQRRRASQGRGAGVA